MNMSIWIDEENCEINNSGVGFLVSQFDENHGTTRYSLRRRPAHTNRSHQPQLFGWCGSWNNVSTDADGLARVGRRAKNGRLCLIRVKPTAAILEELGYPKLAPDDEIKAKPGDDWRFGPEVNRLISQLRDYAGCKLVTTKGEEPTEDQLLRAYGVCVREECDYEESQRQQAARCVSL